MKSLAKKLLAEAAKNDRLYATLEGSFVRAIDYVKILRQQIERERRPSSPSLEETFVDTRLSDLIVRSGPFQGMRYPEAKATGSAVIPKLLGCYEKELHSVIEKICATPYTSIVDIGCAEGYYAVGLAMRLGQTLVYAYDTDSEAIRLCRSMGKLNGVSDRLLTGSFCSAKTLGSLELGPRSLIISDCEGYEKELFNEHSCSVFASHDLLIELHDFIDIEISSLIRRLFSKSHDIQSIKSIDDIEKAHTYEYEELQGFDLPSKRSLLAECRPSIMEWFYLTQKER